MPPPPPSPIKILAAVVALFAIAGCQPTPSARPVPSVAQIGSEKAADRAGIAGIELLCPGHQGVSDRRLGGSRRLRARLPEEERQNKRRR